MPTIAIDASGGTKAPRAPVEAAGLVTRQTGIEVVLVGDPAQIQQSLSKVSYNPERLRVHSAGEGATPDESIRAAAQLVEDNRADALVTAGDAPVALRACIEIFRNIAGVHRAPLAAVYPTLPRPGNRDPFALILDVGSTFRPTAEDLLAWAKMGVSYASRISKVDAPTIGLLSVSPDPLANPPEIARAHRLLSSDTSLRFVGNVAAIDIPTGAADVIVCDGFSGQVIIGLLGGVSDALLQAAKGAWERKVAWRMGLRLLEGAVVRFHELLDHEYYGGAPLLGFDKIAILALPNSGESALFNAVKLAAKAHQQKVVEAVATSLGG